MPPGPSSFLFRPWPFARRVKDKAVDMMGIEYKHEGSDRDDDQIDLAHDDRDVGKNEDGNEHTGRGLLATVQAKKTEVA